MKKSIAIAIAIALMLGVMLAPQAMAGDDNPFLQHLNRPFKTAIIKYKVGGSNKGEETLYIDGSKQAKYSKTKGSIFGITQENNTINIMTLKRAIVVNLKERTARATSNIQTVMAEEYKKLSPAEKKTVKKNAEEMGNTITAQLGGGKPQTKKGTYKGKPVKIVTVMGFTSYVWEKAGVPLKTQGSIMGIDINSEATSIKTGVPVKKSVFQVPDGIEVVFDEKADQAMRNMAKSMMERLKDPNFSSSSVMAPPVAGGQSAGQAPATQEPAKQAPAKDDVDQAVDQGMKLLKGLFSN